MSSKVSVTSTCCKTEFTIPGNPANLAFLNVKRVESLFPQATPWQRRLILIGFCPECWNEFMSNLPTDEECDEPDLEEYDPEENDIFSVLSRAVSK